MLFFIGIMTVYEDFKCGKVRNKWIVLGLFWSLGIILFFLIWYFIASPVTRFFYFNIMDYPPNYEVVVFTINLPYLFRLISNIAIALVISFLMWQFNVWAAGDAKLFVVYSALLPMTFYYKSFFSFFPSFVLMINIFIPIFLYLIFTSIIYLIKHLKNEEKDDSKKRKQSKKDKRKQLFMTFKNMGIMMTAFIGIFLIVKLFQSPIEQYTHIDLFSVQIFIFAGIIIFSNYVIKFIIKPAIFKTIIVLVSFLMFYGLINDYGGTIETVRRTLIMMTIYIIVLSIFRRIIDFHILKTDLKEVRVEDIGKRMSLSEDIMNEIKKDKEFYKEHINRFYSGGLLSYQVEPIKKWIKKNRRDIKTIKIYKPFPFVPWMFVGVIVTIILKGSMFHLIWRLF